MYNTIRKWWGKRSIRLASFVVLGAVFGYLYYNFIGCQNSCPIGSNPISSILVGGLMGYLLTDMNKKDEHRTN